MCVLGELNKVLVMFLAFNYISRGRMRHYHASCSWASCRAVAAGISDRPWISSSFHDTRNVYIKEVSEEAPTGQGCLEGAQLEEWLRCSVPGNQGQLTCMRLRKL